MSTRVRRRWPLALAALLPGCGAADSPEPDPPYVRSDSAGVTIVATAGRVARAESPWGVDSVPDLQIGTAIGSGPEQLFRIAGVRGLADGRIVVADGASRELRFFDRDGAFLERHGREGSGPGEFRGLRLVPTFAEDSLLLHDDRLRRFTLLAPDDGGVRVLAATDMVGAPLRGLGTRVLTLNTVFIFGRQRTGAYTDPADYALYDMERAQGVAAPALADVRGRQRYWSVTSGNPPSVYNIPFDVMPSAAAGERGFFFTAGEERAEILELAPTGELVRILRIAEAPRPVSAEELERFVASRLEGLENPASIAYRRDLYARMPIPELAPAFQALLVDAEGWLWAENHRATERDPSRWIVFDPDGRAHGTVELPASLEVHHIGSDHVLGRWRDELGVEYVRRYRLTRTEADDRER